MDDEQNEADSSQASGARVPVRQMRSKRSTLILGIGNRLLGDDGAGPCVLDSLSSDARICADARLVDGGTLSFTLLPLIEDADYWIVVDAARRGKPPGTVSVMQGEAMDRFVARRGAASVHEVSISELMDMARLGQGIPQRRALVAIEPHHVDWADQPSPEVRNAIPRAADAVCRLLEEWLL